jgi:hypothetical protein
LGSRGLVLAMNSSRLPRHRHRVRVKHLGIVQVRLYFEPRRRWIVASRSAERKLRRINPARFSVPSTWQAAGGGHLFFWRQRRPHLGDLIISSASTAKPARTMKKERQRRIFMTTTVPGLRVRINLRRPQPSSVDIAEAQGAEIHPLHLRVSAFRGENHGRGWQRPR